MKKINKKRLLLFSVILLLEVVLFYSVVQIVESVLLHKGKDKVWLTEKKTIVVDEVEYYPRHDIKVMMILGIDQTGPAQSSNSYRNKGSADSIVLLIFDEAERECSVLHVNRDTMLEMDMLGVRGEYIGTTYGQVALAYTYGDGLASSCVNMKNTLMNFFDGLTIDYYLAMNMDAIPIMNDAVGGVTVNVTDDFSEVDPSITMGELTLKGEQALIYVQTRKNVGDQKNISRMKRQTDYVDGFLHALRKQEQEDADFVTDLYAQIAPYVVSDCPVNTLSEMLTWYAEFTVGKDFTPEGENVLGEEHYEFYADEEKLGELILKLFYAPK